MLIEAVASMTCMGSWAFLPPHTPNAIAFHVDVQDGGSYAMTFSDYSRSNGRWNRNRDGVVTLSEGSEVIATMDHCGDETADLTLPGEPNREFSVKRFDGDFPFAAHELGFFNDGQNEGQGEAIVEAGSAWTDYRSSRWNVTRKALSTGGGQCTLALNGRALNVSYTVVTAPNFRSESLNFDVLIQTPMSELRASTSETNLRVGIVFDGDVAVSAFGQRVGRRLLATDINSPDLVLSYLARASRMAAVSGFSQTASIDLSGSAAAVESLRGCIHSL